MKFSFFLGIFVSAFLVVVVGALMFISLIEITSSVNMRVRDFECDRVWHAPGERNVVLRIDDIQAFAWRETQMKMINDALERNMTLVLGVIPGISGGIHDDVEMFNFILKNKCKVEIAIHGHRHEYREFENLSFADAKKEIAESLRILNDIESDIVTFIPPNNVISNESVSALKSFDIHVVSAGYRHGKHGFSSSSYDWGNEKIEKSEVVLEECSDALDEFGLCVIMFHPQNFVDDNGDHDSEKYNQYLEILDGVGKLDAEVVNFRDLHYDGILFLTENE